MAFGPVQLLVIGVDRSGSQREVLAELRRLGVSEAVRLLDVLVVHKAADGAVERAHPADEPGGVLLETLLGLADQAENAPSLPGDGFWSLDEVIPNDSEVVLVLIEHRWAIGTRDAIHAAGGTAVADAWLHPADLAAAGLAASRSTAVPDR